MDRQNFPGNLSSWIRAISGAIGILLLFAYVMWNNENEKSSTLTQETKINEMRNAENFSPDEAESRKNPVEMKNSTLTQRAKTNETDNTKNLPSEEAESRENQKAETINIEYRQ